MRWLTTEVLLGSQHSRSEQYVLHSKYAQARIDHLQTVPVQLQ